MLHITSGTVEVLTFAYTYQDRNIEFSSLAILLECLTNLQKKKKKEFTTLDRESKLQSSIELGKIH